VPYLAGGVSLAVLAVGSVAPGLLTVFTDRFSRVFPDYRERIARHEGAHFLVGYLLGVPVAGYSLDLGKEHTDFVEARMETRIIQGRLSEPEVNLLAAVAMAGPAAEALAFPEVVGQSADLQLLGRIMQRSEVKIPDAAQQNLTRWGCWTAVNLLKEYSAEFDALREAMASGATVPECVAAIEGAKS